MTARPTRRLWLVFGTAWLLLFLLGALWSIATPIGGAPDEPAHLIKAASVVRGEFIGSPSAAGQVVTVPEYIAYSKAQTCYAFRPNMTAKCITEVPGDPGRLVKAPTTAGLYNPLYYELVGWPSLFVHDSSGIYWIRLVSGAETSLFFALAFWLVAAWRRRVIPLVGLAVATTPMVLFLDGSVNPNSMEIAATLVAFVGVVSITREPDARLIVPRATVVFIASAVAGNMRGLSLLWIAIALLVPFILVGWRQIVALSRARSIRFAVAGIAVTSIGAAVWLFSTNSLGAGLSSGASVPTPGTPGIDASHLLGFAWNFLSTFEYAEGMVGIFGWLDTPAPLLVMFVWSVLAGGLILGSFVLLRGRRLVFVSVLTVVLLLLPPLLQGIYITTGGIIWQGRYILPVFVCVVVGAAACLSDRIALTGSARTRAVALVMALWAIAQFLSFATALRRYSVGLDAGWREMLKPQWAPPGDLPLILAAYIVVVVAAGTGMLLVSRERSKTNASAIAEFIDKSA